MTTAEDVSAYGDIADRDLLAAVVALHDDDNRRAATLLTMLAEIERRGLAMSLQRTSTTAIWWAKGCRIHPGRAQAHLDLGAFLLSNPTVHAALAAADIHSDHARAISDAYDQIRTADTAMSREHSATILAMLLATALGGTASAVTRQGHSLALTAAGDAQRRHAAAARSDSEGAPEPGPAPIRPADNADLNALTITEHANGRHDIRGNIDGLTAEKLRTALSPLAAPKPTPAGDRDPRSPARRTADAFGELLDAYLAGNSTPGSNRPHLIGYLDLAALTRHTAADRQSGPVRPASGAPSGADWPYHFGWTGPVSAALTELVSCDADLSGAVVDGAGVPLTLGRRNRLVTSSQRAAVTLRDRCCIMCGSPATWCQAHHLVHWAHGGTTDLDNLALLCGPCHRAVHQHGWTIALGDDGHPWATPPPTIDPMQKPRPSYHRRQKQRRTA